MTTLTHVDRAKTLIGLLGDILGEVSDRADAHFSIDETELDTLEGEFLPSDSLTDFTLDGREYRFRMGVLEDDEKLRISLIAFSTEDEDEKRLLMLRPHPDTRKTMREWKEMIEGYLMTALGID